MLLNFDEVKNLINSGALLHIAGTESLLKKLPKGNWIGGSTEYFMSEGGGEVTDAYLFVNEFKNVEFRIETYNTNTLHRVASDAYDNGFSVAIMPFESDVHNTYAHNAASYDDMFIKNIVGWISGTNLGRPEQMPLAVNGATGEVTTDDAVVMHLGLSDNETVNIGIVNIFEQDENTPVIEFDDEGFSVVKCRVNGKETVLADYINQYDIDTKLPIVGDYSGVGINISFRSVENGVVSFYAPVFKGIKYRIAKPVDDYSGEFGDNLASFTDGGSMFSCNCILNFLYGELEGKGTGHFFGPITFGEIAYQLMNQTLVYVAQHQLPR